MVFQSTIIYFFNMIWILEADIDIIFVNKIYKDNNYLMTKQLDYSSKAFLFSSS